MTLSQTILAVAFVWFALHWLCWLAFGRTPFIVIARASLMAESGIVLWFELFVEMCRRWHKNVGPRYAAMRFAEAPVEGRE